MPPTACRCRRPAAASRARRRREVFLVVPYLPYLAGRTVGPNLLGISWHTEQSACFLLRVEALRLVGTYSGRDLGLAMATAKQIVALLSSHLEGDSEQFLSIALQVAAAEARQGRRDIAEEIRRLIDKAREKSLKVQGRPVVALVRPRGELENVLSASYPKLRLDDMVLRSRIRSRLDRVVRQQRQRSILREHAKSPISRILLVGPSGTGKTMTASALAGELHLPLFRIQRDALINRFMGETAAKLRVVFDQVNAVRGVYLFDEFDALGAQRASGNDVGEMRRVLNSFCNFWKKRAQWTA
jgi:SpoVK/Ycf46/Vps4 family AAA+-type ATPase